MVPSGIRRQWFGGTDRSAGGARMPLSAETSVEQSDVEGNIRCLENLHMQGSEVFNFSIEVVPGEIEALLAEANCPIDSVDFFCFAPSESLYCSLNWQTLKGGFKTLPHRLLCFW